MLKYLPVPPLWRQTMLLCALLRERYTLAMAQSTRMGPGPQPVPSQPFVGLLYFVLLLLPKLFGPENSWKYGYQTTLPQTQSMHSSLVPMHPVHIISSHPNCGHSLVSFQALRGPYAYQTCQPSLVLLSVTNTSVKSSLCLNQKKFHFQANLLLSLRYRPLMHVTLHPSRSTQTGSYLRLSEPTSRPYSESTTPCLTLSSLGTMDPQAPTKQRSTWALEQLGVFRRPEDVDINVEYLNPSFLVMKPNGGSRLVTAFADVGRYSKPQPSLLPDVDSTLRLIAQWSHIIVTDLTSAFYQIPLAKESMKYCGVATPFKGVRVYVRSAMGMPGSETALEEVMCRVLGPLLQDGCVAKIADDLYCGGNTPQELLCNWKRVLQALHKCNLRLSAHKTIISPKTTTILG